ncbi:MAG TPA: hypothetical protein PKD86_17425 [Gemmatales bacterium]|nr:hypothetical protein [Gemmatales bacterium]HMP61127.1 hypothetical protein [Gemmatales bacterium]
MQPRDWFVVGARLFGLWVLFIAFELIAHWLGMRLSLIADTQSEASGHLYRGLVLALFAGYLLFGTEHLAGLCFRGSQGPDGREAEPGEPPA